MNLEKIGNLTYSTRIDPATEEYLPAEGRRKVFISYKKSDNHLSGVRDIAIKKILRMADVAVWYDENLTPGVNYKNEIIDAISACDAVVLLLTDEILESSFVWDVEIRTAVKQKKGIIPISFGIPHEEYQKVEKKLGDTVQILKWPTYEYGAGSRIAEKEMQDAMAFDDALERALKYFVVNADLALRVQQFFASGKQNISMKNLNDEQKYLMAVGFLRGVGTDNDEHRGIKILDKLTLLYDEEDGDEESSALAADAAMELVRYYAKSDSTSRLRQYVGIAEHSQNEENLYDLGAMYSKGDVIEKDAAKAYCLFRKSADRNYAPAYYGLGFLYLNGEGVERDTATAVQMFRMAAGMGYAGAIGMLGTLYDKGEGVPQDIPKAIELYRKAADMGNPVSMCRLGFMLSKGKGVEKDYMEAYRLYEKAAGLGHPPAICCLGYMYANGQGVAKDKSKAFELYRKAADMGHIGSFCSLGMMYCRGEGVEKDKVKAVELFEKAAGLGHAPSIFTLGVMYKYGDTVSQDKTKAVELFKKAADMGYARAVYFLGTMYADGEGVKQDKEKAAELYRKAAEMGSAEAKSVLAKSDSPSGKK